MRLPFRRRHSFKPFTPVRTCLTTPSTEQAIHLYRALLRQCTYLPDAAARSYMREHVISRFRDYAPRKPVHRYDRKPAAIILARRPALLKTARKGVLFLQRANNGHPQHLGKVLAMTYGRIGKRRHVLLKELKIPDLTITSETIKEIEDPRNKGVTSPTKMMQVLIRAQAKRKEAAFSRPPLKRLQPVIPEKNSWGRPMPVRRVRNIKKKWYADTLDRIMAPLPEKEWERLRRLATGQEKWEGPVPRRGNLQGDERAREKFRLDGGSLSRPHEITARSMKRVWGKIWVQCPLMWRDESRNGAWAISWGNVEQTKEVVLAPKRMGKPSMFEGVDEHGKVRR